MSETAMRLVSALGLIAMMGIALLASSDRRRVAWKTVAWGLGIQFSLALVLLKTMAGQTFFAGVAKGVDLLLDYTNAGTRFVFGPLLDTGFSFALGVLPIIVFMGSLFSILYHLGWVQRIVRLLARLLARSMRLSGAESLAAVANVFVGMVESCLIIKPYIERMTRSELFTAMTLGMSTVAGSVLLAYVNILGGGAFAGHLVTASILSAPAGLLIAKIMIPETGEPQTMPGVGGLAEERQGNVIDAAAEGAVNGLKLAAYVGATLIAFVALIAMLNDIFSGVGELTGIPDLTLQRVLGVLLAPLAFLMGVPWSDAPTVGSLIGLKTVLNEFLAFQQLGDLMAAGELGERSRVIASYALCGFANFGSLAILLGGIGGIAPSRRPEVASLGLRSILAGSLASFMTACMAGLLT
ncbi:MAG: NupC/NupG family nucleoside CNT transporter [Myxococcota bacterium]|nr:NupC/NupG family nucleoside CNT transporter [Myxococcota bacterium]